MVNRSAFCLFITYVPIYYENTSSFLFVFDFKLNFFLPENSINQSKIYYLWRVAYFIWYEFNQLFVYRNDKSQLPMKAELEVDPADPELNEESAC